MTKNFDSDDEDETDEEKEDARAVDRGGDGADG